MRITKLYPFCLKVLVVLVLFTGWSSFTQAASTCVPPCPSGWYECNHGTMCCKGSGCPSWVCEAMLDARAFNGCNNAGCSDGVCTVRSKRYKIEGSKCTYEYTVYCGDTKGKHIISTVSLYPPHACMCCGSSPNCSEDGGRRSPPPPPTISEFRITNFVKRKDPEGKKFYIILAEQMKVGFKANIAWTVAHASSCTASCVYKDRQGNPIPEDCEWSGKVSASGGKRKVQPKTPGVVEYKLKCSGAGGSASASFSAGIKELKWKEVHPASFLEPLVLPVAQTFSDSLLAAVKLMPKEDKR